MNFSTRAHVARESKIAIRVAASDRSMAATPLRVLNVAARDCVSAEMIASFLCGPALFAPVFVTR
jgi:hypothetical protein